VSFLLQKNVSDPSSSDSAFTASLIYDDASYRHSDQTNESIQNTSLKIIQDLHLKIFQSSQN